MSERVIPLVDQRLTALRAEVPAHDWDGGVLLDQHHRPMHDLRISVTDRCNFRCNYCMPKEVFNKDYSYLPHGELLNFEEITRLAKVFVGLGVRKIRLTGGEPLLRKNLEILVQQLAQIQTPDGSKLDLTLTTNGSLLTKKAQQLKDAGLDRITVSLDGLDDAVFRAMNDVDFPVRDVLDGIEAAQKAGLGIKVNMVVKRHTNTNQIIPMAKHFRGSGIALRFIEYMDVGVTNGWRKDEVLPSADIVALVQEAYPLVVLPESVTGETAQRWGYTDTKGNFDPALGEIGVISSVTQAFCGTCNRARLSTEGKLYLCLFASLGYDLRELMRDREASDTQLASSIANIWNHRDDRYSELRASIAPDTDQKPRRVEMSYIGG
jgi:cyclic pyranopterin phosphate synthase